MSAAAASGRWYQACTIPGRSGVRIRFGLLAMPPVSQKEGACGPKKSPHRRTRTRSPVADARRNFTSMSTRIRPLRVPGCSGASSSIAVTKPELVPVLPTLELPMLPFWIAMHEDLSGDAAIRPIFDTVAQGVQDHLEQTSGVWGLGPSRVQGREPLPSSPGTAQGDPA